MKIAAGTRYEHAAATPDVPVSKDTQKSLAFHQKRVYNLLQFGRVEVIRSSELHTRSEGKGYFHPRRVGAQRARFPIQTVFSSEGGAR